ncbi:hypothetical protein AB6A40_000088 [Gnathostoma spinigerum]|uniref:Membrane-bound transcription factor site-1 protease n=1 Tax=Gnathostoma spinigerum TaxID=75299 RepID=A0ABD6E1C9_9BILA
MPLDNVFIVFCLLLKSICVAFCTDHSTIFLISYDGYYDLSGRLSLIRESIKSSVSVSLQKRPNALSDFDVIEVVSCNATDISKRLERSVHVRHVSFDYTHHLSSTRRIHGIHHSTTSSEIREVAKLLNVSKLWDMGFKGQGVKVAVFDTGLARRHSHFRQIIERTDWTNEKTADDVGLGHGTFVAGVIASSSKQCPGLAPSASIYIYKVFTKKQVSYTSWFLDAFNHAILRGINVLNLSIGGPDFTDLPFMEKVWELTANGVILISAIGNDGPMFGTLNNPADQMDVIGVGGINSESRIARFSSRGMTTWELPGGYGRLKPDIVTYGASVYGSAVDESCRALSGTSVASPVVSGAVAVMLSGIDDRRLWNPAVVKQVLVKGATRLSNPASMFEQGAGKVDIVRSFNLMRTYRPSITMIPPYLDFTECPYMWPYCSQPLYAFALPITVNVTIMNGLGVSGKITEAPIWEPFMEENGDLLQVSIDYEAVIWPWSGYMAVSLSVSPKGKDFEGTASGRISVSVMVDVYEQKKLSTATFLIRARIIPTPSRRRRIIWDQYRNMRYPPGYLPRDDLRDRGNPLDWTADHPHTTFKALYQHLRSSDYYIEILGEPLTCVDLSQYYAYVIVDPEEEFFPSEREKLYRDVTESGVNLIVFADWYNTSVIDKLRFLDENTRRWWQPETGGSNIPALNDLLSLWNMTLGNQVFEGTVFIDDLSIKYGSGTSFLELPEQTLIVTANLTDVGAEIISGEKSSDLHEVIVFAFYLPAVFDFTSVKSGFVAVFGDSTCLEGITTANQNGCIIFFERLLGSDISPPVSSALKSLDHAAVDFHSVEKPKRPQKTNFCRYSKVLSSYSDDGKLLYKPLPTCRLFAFSSPKPLFNTTVPSDLRRNLRKYDSGEESERSFKGGEDADSQLAEVDLLFGLETAPNEDGNSQSVLKTHHVLRIPVFVYLILFLFLLLCYNRARIRRRFPRMKSIRRVVQAICFFELLPHR